MSGERPIGVFDSGVGGLTVLHALRTALPDESTVYLGDVARLPYGPRPQGEVRRFALEIAAFLTRVYDVKAIVIACNTASAAALDSLRVMHPGVPIVGVIGPGARAAARASRGGHIGVIATAGTVASGAYTRAVHAVAPDAVVHAQPCPDLVPLVEDGLLRGPMTDAILRGYLAPLLDAGIDTLILGCTHYPLLRAPIEEIVGEEVTVVDSAQTSATEAAALLRRLSLLRGPTADAPTHRLLSTDDSAAMHDLAVRLFGQDVGPVETVNVHAECDATLTASVPR